MVSRFREEMARGADRVEATGRTMATAGRAVMLSGVTVAIGLAVLVALPVPFIRSMGIGGMLVAVSAVLAGLTLLPAVLCVLGPRVDSLRVYPRRWRLREGAIWGPLSKAVTGWGAPVAAIALVGLIALASSVRLLRRGSGRSGDAEQSVDSKRDEARVDGQLLGRLLRGVLVVVEAGDLDAGRSSAGSARPAGCGRRRGRW